MNTKVDEGKLISGKEALIALANGKEVETKKKDEITWSSIGFFAVNIFKDEKWEFRLRPRTITINSIEVPSVRYIAHSGGNCVKISCHCPEDARVVNAALRQVFGGSHDN